MPTLPNFIVMLHHHTDRYSKNRVMIRVVVERKSKYLRTEMRVFVQHFNPNGKVISKKGGRTVIQEDKWITTGEQHHDEYSQNRTFRVADRRPPT